MSGFAIQSFLSQLSTPVIKAHVRTMPRGSWKWQDACQVRLVRCPRNESPDLRRRGHELVLIVAAKVAAGTARTRAIFAGAEAYAAELNAA